MICCVASDRYRIVVACTVVVSYHVFIVNVITICMSVVLCWRYATRVDMCLCCTAEISDSYLLRQHVGVKIMSADASSSRIMYQRVVSCCACVNTLGSVVLRRAMRICVVMLHRVVLDLSCNNSCIGLHASTLVDIASMRDRHVTSSGIAGCRSTDMHLHRMHAVTVCWIHQHLHLAASRSVVCSVLRHLYVMYSFVCCNRECCMLMLHSCVGICRHQIYVCRCRLSTRQYNIIQELQIGVYVTVASEASSPRLLEYLEWIMRAQWWWWNIWRISEWICLAR